MYRLYVVGNLGYEGYKGHLAINVYSASSKRLWMCFDGLLLAIL
jgi:hypothetical protein